MWERIKSVVGTVGLVVWGVVAGLALLAFGAWRRASDEKKVKTISAKAMVDHQRVREMKTREDAKALRAELIRRARGGK